MGARVGGLSDFDNVVALSRAFIGLLFVAAGVAKLFDRRAFASAVAAYRILPPGWASAVARAVPPVEIAVGVAFSAGIAPRAAGTAIALLLTAFSVAVAVNLVRGRRTIDCGCFGSRSGRGISWAVVVRNGTLAATALAAGWASGIAGGAGRALPAVLAALAGLAVYAAVRALVSILRLDDGVPVDEVEPHTAATRVSAATVGSSSSREGA